MSNIDSPFPPGDPRTKIASKPRSTSKPATRTAVNSPDAHRRVYEIQRSDGVASEKAILVRVILPGQTVGDDPLDEITGLAETAGARVVSGLLQRRETPDVTAYLGKGKIEELTSVVKHHDADVVIFDNDLAPSQTRNLERAVGV